jgi:hypothetical protein
MDDAGGVSVGQALGDLENQVPRFVPGEGTMVDKQPAQRWARLRTPVRDMGVRIAHTESRERGQRSAT